MLSYFYHSLHVGLSRTSITLLKRSGLVRPQTSLLTNVALPEGTFRTPEVLSTQLDNVFAASGCTKLPVTLTLSDDLVRLLMVTPPGNAGSVRDCRAAAEMRFQDLYGEPVSGWTLEADWNARHSFVACAIPTPLLKVLEQAALKYQLTLISVTPQFIAMWNQYRRKLQVGAWFAVVQDKTLTLGVIEERRLCAVRTSAVPNEAWEGTQWLPEHLAREALRLRLPVPASIQFCGALPGQWAAQKMGTLNCGRLDKPHPSDESRLITSGVELATSGIR